MKTFIVTVPVFCTRTYEVEAQDSLDATLIVYKGNLPRGPVEINEEDLDTESWKVKEKHKCRTSM